MDVSLRKIAKGAGVGFIGSIFGMFLGYLSRVIIARLLNASDYGIICLGFTAMSIAYTLALLGIYGGVQRFVAFHIGKKDVRRAKGTILTAFAICCVSSLVTSILIVRYADWLSVFVFHEDALAPVLRAFAIAVPSMVFTNLSISITLGFQEVKYKVYINDILQNASKIILITAAILLGFGVVGAAWGWSISIIAMGFISLYIIKKVFPPLFFRDVKAIFECRELIAYSLPLFLAGVSGLVMTWTDTLMLGYFATPADVGIYNVASPTAKLISAIGGSFSVIFFPVISGLLAMQRLEEIKVTYSVVTKWILMILTPIVVLAAAFPEHIIGIIFGAEYITGAHALGVLSLSYFLCSLFG
ncbi:MAG: Membrane protein involved in the export of O-antigen and teichoic acid, partial [Candidatus Alkanophagales archaeon MCA70_species_2]|nr:Membrane protein involved in the export of O-antigen and teichoic acid [Candidatus Alkanophaga liquidiphilum]